MTHLDRSFIIWSAFTLALGCQDPPKTYNDGSQGPLLPPVAGEGLSGGMMNGGGSAGEMEAGETQAGELLAGETLRLALGIRRADNGAEVTSEWYHLVQRKGDRLAALANHEARGGAVQHLLTIIFF